MVGAGSPGSLPSVAGSSSYQAAGNTYALESSSPDGNYPRDVRSAVVILITAALMIVGALPAMAADRATADFVVVGVDEIVEEDLYAVGNSVDVRGTIDGDLIAFSGTEVRISGVVTGDVIAVTGSVIIEGTVEGSVRATAGSVSVSGTVERDLVIVAGSADVTGRVGQDLLAWGWSLNLAGAVDGFVWGQMIGVTRISGDVGRDFEMTVGSLEVLDGTSILGDLGYKAKDPALVADSAVIGGQLIQREQTRQNIRIRAVGLVGAILGLLLFVAGGLAMFWMAPRTLEKAAIAAGKRWPASLITGILLLPIPLVIPAVIGTIATTAEPDVAFPLALALVPIAVGVAGIFVLAIIIAPVPALTAVGRRIAPRRSAPFGFLVGAGILLVLSLIPIVRWVVVGAVALFGLGAWVVGAVDPFARLELNSEQLLTDSDS